DSLPCEKYVVEPAVQTNDIVRLGEVTGSPGETVEIPVFLTNNVSVEGYQLVIRCDPSVFTPLPGQSGLSFEGTFYEGRRLASFSSARPLAEEGLFVVGFIPHLTEDLEVPPGADRLVFKIVGTI